MTVAEYAARFDELVKFCPHYNGAAVKGFMCIMFESGVHPDIKQGIGY